jgi:hypothetical protein
MEVYVGYFFDENGSNEFIGVFEHESELVLKSIEFLPNIKHLMKSEIPLDVIRVNNIDDFVKILSKYGNENQGGSPGWYFKLFKTNIVK